MSRIKSILKDSDSQWSLLTATTHHRSPPNQGNRKKETGKLSSLDKCYVCTHSYISNTHANIENIRKRETRNPINSNWRQHIMFPEKKLSHHVTFASAIDDS